MNEHLCSVKPPPIDCVSAAWSQLTLVGFEVVDAGDLVSKSGMKWLQHHGFITRYAGHAMLSSKGMNSDWGDVSLEYAKCVESKPGEMKA